MLTGMGTVFVFLSALVLAMNLLAKLVLRLPQSATPVGGETGAGIRPEEVAAISAALHLHRRRKQPHD